MANHVLLNNIHHDKTRVISRYAEQYADNVASVLVFPNEFMELQKEYPILFRLDEASGNYQSVVLLGLHKGENLFLDDAFPSGWRADYIPAMVEKGPFLIGFQQQDAQPDPEPMIHIDLDHPKVNEQEGHQVFLEHGGNSPYLNYIAARLKLIHDGMAAQDDMFELFKQLDLLESVNIEFELANGEKCRLLGNFTINEEKLMALDGDQLVKLNRSGCLHLAYAVISSMSNIRKLIAIKNHQSN
ncbi:SapC family protein [Aliiglaciecola sp. LCG003]|uniref:SapC family protein n=1 Tax=Aliiglaciecola sp. LCG003 TaxID=3053655 RepID=UPI002572F16A|nr:SapC family protein [Aliiglaciecola sp. LCG003]WJG09539.1 SapC family protein [Aliiglaciecola sp. LCG003]